MTASLSGVFNCQQFTDAGNPAAGFRLYTYAPSTTTHKVVYTDAGETTPHTYTSDGLGGQYIALNSRGELASPLYLSSGGYDLCLKTSAGATVWTKPAKGAGDYASDILSSLGSGGAALIGTSDAGDYFAGTTVEAVLQDLGLSRKKLVDVSAYPWLCDMTGATNSSASVWAAQQYAASIGAGLYIPPGILYASIALRQNNVAVIGAGSSLSTIKLPSEGITITSIQCTAASPHVVTITTSAAHGAWIGKGISVAGSSQASENVPYIVTGVTDATHLTASTKAFAGVVGTYAGGAPKLYESSVLELGEGTHGNLATAYSGAVIRGLTIDGNAAARPANPTDTTDWGLFLTSISDFHISDIVAQNCQSVGFGCVINSRDGYIQGIADSCGATVSYPGFDINSSQRITVDVVTKNCYQGARVLDNCYGIQGRITVYNATSIGFIAQNQLGNSSHACHLSVAVETTGSHGAVISEGMQASTLRLTVKGAGDIGVNIPTATNPAQDCIIEATTINSQNGGLVCFGNRNNIAHTSRLDGRAGAAGTSYATDISGTGNTLAASVYDTGTPQVRGVILRAAATDTRVSDVYAVGIVGGASAAIDDQGSGTRVPDYLRRTVAVGSTTYTVLGLDEMLNCSAGAAVTLTLPTASTCPGKRLTVRTIAAYAVNSASSNVVPLVGGAAGTAIVTNTAGKWALLVSDGTNWNIQQGN